VGRRASQSAIYAVPYPTAFDAAVRILGTLGMTVESADQANGAIHAKHSMSVRTWGEVISVLVRASGTEGTQVEVTSALKLGLADWGKNKTNVARIHEAIAADLTAGSASAAAAAPAPAAWLPDPLSRHEHRWWDGQRWTESVSDGGVVSTDPLA
jgi:hypothetical protein